MQTLRDHECQPRLLYPAKHKISPIPSQKPSTKESARRKTPTQGSWLHAQSHRQHMITQQQIPKNGKNTQ